MREYIRIENIWHLPANDYYSTKCNKQIAWFGRWDLRTLRSTETILPVYAVDAVRHAQVIPDIACVECAMLDEKTGGFR